MDGNQIWFDGSFIIRTIRLCFNLTAISAVDTQFKLRCTFSSRITLAQLINWQYTIFISRQHEQNMHHSWLQKGQVYIWRKRLLPAGSFALMFIYVSISGGPTRVEQKLSDIGLVTSEDYVITDAFSGKTLGTYKPWYTFNCEVNPTGVRVFTAIVKK